MTLTLGIQENMDIVDDTNALQEIFLKHQSTDAIPDKLHSLFYRLSNYSYRDFLIKFNSSEFKKLRNRVGDISRKQFEDVIVKIISTSETNFTIEEQNIIDAINKTMESWTFVEDVIDFSDRWPIRGIYFFVSDKTVGVPKIGNKDVTISFKKENIKDFKSKYNYKIFDGDHIDKSVKQLTIEQLFETDTYKGRTARNFIELEILTDILDIQELRATISK